MMVGVNNGEDNIKRNVEEDGGECDSSYLSSDGRKFAYKFGSGNRDFLSNIAAEGGKYGHKTLVIERSRVYQ